MKRSLVLLSLVLSLAFSAAASASVQFFNSSGQELGHARRVKCSANQSCSFVTGQLNLGVPTALTATGSEAGNADLLLQADESDDSGDDWRVRSAASGNTLSFLNDGTGSAVALFTLTTAGTASLTGLEAGDVSLTLQADESDDNGDDWRLQVAASGNSLTFSSDASGSHVALFTLTTAGHLTLTGDVTGDGGDQLGGFLQTQTASTTTAVTAAQCGTTLVSNSADVMTLPEASTVLGCRLTFIAGTADDFDVNPADATDTIAAITASGGTITPSAGDAIRLTDIGASVTLEAIGADTWAAVAHNGAITDVN